MARVLIVCYTFNLNTGVGARRWLKYANRLAKKGHEVSILTTDVDPTSIDSKISVYTISPNYPTVLNSQPTTLISKLLYKFHQTRLFFSTKGTIYDVGARLEQKVSSSVQRIISEQKINNIIASGAPFSLLYFIAKIKQQNKSINFIADLRDPWTWGIGYGMNNLSAQRLEYEKYKEQFVLKNADYIISASQDLKNVLDKKLACQNKQSTLVINGIESNNIARYSSTSIDSTHINSNGIIISHIGTASNDSEKYWKPLFLYIEQSSINYQLNFYANTNTLIANWVAQHNPKKIKLNPRVNEARIQSILQESSYLLFFKNDNFPDSFPSKFFDYIKSAKPLLLYTKKGQVSEEVVNNEIGLVLDEYYDYIDFSEDLNHFQYNRDYDWRKFSVETLVANIEALFI